MSLVKNSIIAFTAAVLVAGSSSPAISEVHWSSIQHLPTGLNQAQLRAILYDIPWGQDWITTCQRTPGLENRIPDGCNKGANVFGYWQIPFANLAQLPSLHWDTNFGFRFIQGQGIVIRSILWGIPAGQNWEATCKRTPGLRNRVPDTCSNEWGHIWGHWLVLCSRCSS